MQQRFTRARALAIALAGATTVSMAVIPGAAAAVDGGDVVINEVYGGGGNSGATLKNDFVELHNPTSADIDLSGHVIEYFSSKGSSGGKHTLAGTIPAGGFYLLNLAAGNGGNSITPGDENGSIAMAGKSGSVKLFNPAGDEIDLVGYGSTTLYEGTATPELGNSTSAARRTAGVDTDNNAADFIVAAPTPTNSLGETASEIDPGGDTGGNPVAPVEPGTVIPIAQIQGTGASTPLKGQTVTTEGVVTAAYPEGGKNGFYLQTAGSGGTSKSPGEASDGIFIYLGSNPAAADFPEIGASLTVTGTADEYFEATQITATLVADTPAPLAPVAATEIGTLPAGDEAREVYEGMLLRPTGDHTVTNNYTLNTHGTIDLAPGTEPFMQATDVHTPDTDPNSPVQQLMAEQAAQSITLDDGRTRNYMNSDTATPLPWIAQDGGQSIKSLRTGDQVDFQNPVVLDYSFEAWTFQPTSPVTGDTAGVDLPITWEDSRAAELGAMATVEGDFSVASFNVLNYFTSLGKDHNCGSYTDRDGAPVASRSCDVRGAYTQEAFNDQETKIVNAINLLDASVVSLEEIENTAAVTGRVSDRDHSLSELVDALNTAAGSAKWAYVKSPTELGEDEDVIRVAFIYQPAEVTPVGQSRIFNDNAYTGLARQPLAQEFRATDVADGETFIAIANHFKSKGSVSRGDGDIGDGQGNNPNVRNAQAQAMVDHLNKQADWAGKPIFILGDLNAYSRETAITTLESNGFTNIVAEYDAGETYQFSGRIGSLDHALGNAAALENVVDAEVWDINGDESIAFEYSRRNYNIVDFHDDSPFRSSDHDPIKVGFNLDGVSTAPGQDEEEDVEETPTGEVERFEINEAGELILFYGDGTSRNLGQVVGADGANGAEGENGENGTDGQDGRGVATFEINEAGELIVTYTDGTSQNLGQVNGADGADGANGSNGENGTDGAAGTDGREGGSVLETALGFLTGFAAMGGVVAWVVNTFFPELRNGVINQFNSIFR